jgi:DNA-binding transcriptional regulator YiaG
MVETLHLTGAELKTARKLLSLSQEAFAVILGGYDRRTICRWENGECRVPKAVKVLLANAIKTRKGEP